MRSFWAHFHKNSQTIFAVCALVLVELILLFTNYSPNTYLVGWDTVMPEFDLALNFKRAFFSLWQEYRGLGTLDGMSHAANLMHTVFVTILSVFLPQSLIRYVFIHLCHLFGGISMFLLLKQLFPGVKRDTWNMDQKNTHGFMLYVLRFTLNAPLLGALFYMLNLGIIQQFYAPLEVFAVHFVALPLLTLHTIQTLRKPTTRNYLFLFLASIATSIQGFVPTVFAVYMLLLCSLLVFHILFSKQFKVALTIFLLILGAHSFWLLPYMYSAIHTPSVITQTRINQLSSEEIFYRNKAHGNLSDVFFMKGFMLDTIEMDTTTTEDVFFMDTWRTQQQSLLYRILYTIILCITVFGMFQILRHKDRSQYPYLLAFAVALFFLANNTPLLEQANALLRTVLPVIAEAYRFPFTKFITLFAFCFTLFFTYGLQVLLLKTQNIKQKTIQTFSVFSFQFLLFSAIITLSFPAFQGYFTSPYLRLQMPKEYSSLFSYFKTIASDKRIAMLPAVSFWNWQYRDWQFRGSGFHWYGMSQPTMHRAFDPWSLENEQFYNELAHALNRQNTELLEKVLEKYQIAYLLLDTQTLNPLTKRPIDYVSLERFLQSQPFLQKDQTFGKLVVYKTNFQSSWITAIPLNSVKKVPAKIQNTREDIVFESGSMYIVDAESANYQPLFPSLYTEKLQEDTTFTVTEHDQTIEVSPKQQSTTQQEQQLTIPSLVDHEFLLPVTITPSTRGITITLLQPTIMINSLPIQTPPLTLDIPTQLTQPESITMHDLDYVVENTQQSVFTTYLLNKRINSLTLQKGNQTQTIYVDPATFPQLNRQPIAVSPNDHITVHLPKVQSPFSDDTVIKNGTYEITEKDPNSLEQTPQSLTNVQETDEGLLFSARKSNITLTSFNPSLFHQAAYLILVDATHDTGLPMDFYIDNPYQYRSELDTKLTKSEREHVFVLLKTEDFFEGYGIHLRLRSVGEELARTTIHSLKYYPFPHAWLSQLSLTSTVAPIQEKSAITSLPYTKPNLSQYTVNTDTLIQENGDALLTLSQSYDKGWKAYEVQGNNQQSTINKYITGAFPFLFGKEIQKHVVVNSWANGWLINQATNQSTIVLLYLPQYLHFAGVFITLGLFISLLSKYFLHLLHR